MDADLRLYVYLDANGVRRLTPRQRRRIGHKRNHQAAPFGTRKTGASPVK